MKRSHPRVFCPTSRLLGRASPGTLSTSHPIGGIAVLRILGSPRRLCDGVTRRDFLQVGALGTLGLALDGVFRLQHADAAPARKPREGGFGRAKNVILL